MLGKPAAGRDEQRVVRHCLTRFLAMLRHLLFLLRREPRAEIRHDLCLSGCATCGDAAGHGWKRRRWWRSHPKWRRGRTTKPTAGAPKRPDPHHTDPSRALTSPSSLRQSRLAPCPCGAILVGVHVPGRAAAPRPGIIGSRWTVTLSPTRACAGLGPPRNGPGSRPPRVAWRSCRSGYALWHRRRAPAEARSLPHPRSRPRSAAASSR
jgi:hypothetical protein